MKPRTSHVLICLLVALSACGGGQLVDESNSDDDQVATTQSLSEPTVPETTTTAAPTTTTTAPITTTEQARQDLPFTLSNANAGVLSARIEGTIEMTGLDVASAGLGEFSMTFTTSFDTRTGNSAFRMDMSAMLGELESAETEPFADMFAELFGEMEFRQIGDIAYLKFPFFGSMLGSETEWVSMPAEDGQSYTSDFETMPTDPYELLDAFASDGVTIEEVGSEHVNGVDAIHYRLSLDTEAMDLSDEEKAELAASGVFAEGVIPVEIWMSEDGYMIRMIMEIDGSGMDVPPEEQFDTMVLRYDMFDVNGDIDIDPPPPSQVTPIEDLEQTFFGFEEFGPEG